MGGGGRGGSGTGGKGKQDKRGRVHAHRGGVRWVRGQKNPESSQRVRPAGRSSKVPSQATGERPRDGRPFLRRGRPRSPRPVPAREENEERAKGTRKKGER